MIELELTFSEAEHALRRAHGEDHFPRLYVKCNCRICLKVREAFTRPLPLRIVVTQDKS